MSDAPKYRQRGYKDSEREERGGGRGSHPQAPREKKDGPRGRGLGAPSESVFRCAACGEKQLSAEEVAPEATCKKCGAALHACSNCMHFDTSRRFECRQADQIPERIARKNAANTCPLFAVKVVSEFAKDRDKPADPRAAFDALFK
ncbi:MAG TPA: hypothetical protein VMM92_07510 [Thermoanaerobaculia bacterium]|nr:hypothetical protein [Thermoanaerobaculia bacterium]